MRILANVALAICFAVTLVFVELAAARQSAAQEPAVEDPAHDEIRALRDRMVKALNEKDLATVLDGVDSEVVFTSMDGRVARGRDAIQDYYKRMLEGPTPILENISVNLEADALSILYGGDTAVAYGHSRDRYAFVGGAALDVDARWTTTLVKREGQWKIASLHLSAGLFDNPILQAAARTGYWIAGGAALVAIVLGFLLGRRSARTA
jgi:uncharacterized protein (TIGR02246 family)